MKKVHHYRVTLERLSSTAEPVIAKSSLSFETTNHDDILAIVQRMQQRGDFEPDTAAALAVGLKLFGEVMLHERDNPLFVELIPHFGQFMKKLKQGVA